MCSSKFRHRSVLVLICLCWIIDQSTMSSCFNCHGDVSNKDFVGNEQNFNSTLPSEDENQSHCSTLFGYSFNKGHTLLYDIPLLFKIAK